MSQSVDKLKQLLFQPESDAIASLSARIDQVFDRAGTTERFQASVAGVLDGALREAEVARHDEVASAIAPLIVRTVKTEIHNSTDDLVEALYPATGRMVKAYVASAIRDLTNEINRRLDANPVMLGLNSLLSGRSATELALADSQRLKVEDVFLVRRATGELVARWPQGQGQSNLDHVMGGVLTAINEFTSEAFKADGSALRQIDLGPSVVYLRVSPAYLLAAKCSGTAPADAEQVFDTAFLDLMDNHHAALDTDATRQGGAPQLSPLLQNLSGRIEAGLGDLQPSNTTLKRGVRPLTLLAMLIGIPLAGWLAWNIYIDTRLGRVEAIARSTVNATAELNGYPSDIKASERGRVVTIVGLVPTEGAKSSLIERLEMALPGVAINDRMSAVPVGSADVRPLLTELKLDQRTFEAGLKAAAAKQSQAQAARLMERTVRLLEASDADATASERASLGTLKQQASRLTAQLRAPLSPDEAASLPGQIQELAEGINALALSGLKSGAGLAALRAEADPAPVHVDDALVDAAGRGLSAARAFVQLGAVKRRLEDDTARLRESLASSVDLGAVARRFDDETARLRASMTLTPRAALESFARANAIFFADNTAFRDEAEANRTLDELARLIARDGSLVRLVGFTDDQGTPAKNQAIARSRADTVMAALVARGVAPNRLVALGRASSEYNVSLVVGSGSTNRRVEFEVGFIGEGPR